MRQKVYHEYCRCEVKRATGYQLRIALWAPRSILVRFSVLVTAFCMHGIQHGKFP
jgi:hypothetical protein